MKRLSILFFAIGVAVCLSSAANAQLLIGGSTNNGNLDRTHASEVVPGFFLPKPDVWVYQGTRTISGPFQDGLSSEPWAGPAPTPVTTDGNLNPPSPEGCGGPDCAVFYKAFTGNATDGPVNVDLYQDVPGTAGLQYLMTGWAGAEANFLGTAQFALEFRNGGGGLISGSTLNLNTAGLLVPNGEAFNYKRYSLLGTAPAGTATVRVRSSLLGGLNNPLGGGQAFVVDDFTLIGGVPEPTTVTLGLLGGLSLIGFMRRR